MADATISIKVLNITNDEENKVKRMNEHHTGTQYLLAGRMYALYRARPQFSKLLAC